MTSLSSSPLLDLDAFARAVASVADTAFIAVDSDGVVATWNAGAALMTGVSAAQAIGRPLPEACRTDDDALGDLAAIAAVGELGAEVLLARDLIGQDHFTASTRVCATARPIRHGWLLTLRATSQALPGAAPEPTHGLLLPAIREIVVMTDLQGLVTYWNRAATDMLGFEADERIGRPLFAFAPKERREDLAAFLAAAGAGAEWEGEYPARHKDGSVVWVEARVSALRNDAGEPIALVTIAHDIRARKRAEAARAEREGAYRAATETTGDGYWVIGAAEGRFLEVNDVYARCSGYTREELLQMRISDVEALEDQGEVRERLTRIQQRGHDRFETFHRRKDGSRWPVEVTVSIAPDSGKLYVFVRDISERRRAEAALRESEERFRSVLDGSPAVVYLKDFEGRYLFVNRTLAEIVGRPAREFVGFTAHDFFPREIADEFDRNDGVVRSTLRPHQIEEAAFLPDGRAVTFLSVQFPLFREDRTPYAMCGISTDITDRKRTQEERDRLWNHSPDPLCVLDLDGSFTQVNPAWTERLGWSEAELLARSCRDLMHVEDVPATVTALDRLRAGEQVRNFETRLRTRDDQWRWFSWNAQPMPDGHVHAFVRDITDEKRLDEQMRQSQKLEAIGRLAGGVAHDFNNLLTVINGYTALLLGGDTLQRPQREPLMAIRDAGARAASLTAQLLAFGRKAMLEPKTLDLNEVATASTRMLGRLIGEDVRLVTQLAPGLPKVRIDPSQLDQVLVNLVVNARDAMPTGGLLRIITTLTRIDEAPGLPTTELPPGPYVQLTVSDTGAGIDEDVRAHIFEPFYTTKGIGQGTGLGLATVYAVVRQAGGTVTVETERGHGSAFHVLLPALPADDAVAMATISTPAPRGHERVLVVEDEPGVRQLTRLLLEAQGYEVRDAASARQAFAVAESDGASIDLLITDVVMPGMSGRQLAAALREQYPQLRVLFMSGYTDDAVLRHGVEASVDAFLQKPFTPAALARRVRDLLDGPR